MTDKGLLAEQIAYYRARAPEYEQPLYGNPEASGLIDLAVRWVPAGGDVLEIACGTGVWTRRLAPRAARYTAIDAAPEMLEIARANAPGVEFVRADVLSWAPPRRFDTVFFGFWLSHVPSDRYADFWRTVADALAPDGRAVFVAQHVTASRGEVWLGEEIAQRTLSDGSRHRVVKAYLDPQPLRRRLAELGWRTTVERLGRGWVIGEARPVDGL